MKTIIIGYKENVSFEVVGGDNIEPSIKAIRELTDEEIIVKELETDVEYKCMDKIYLNKTQYVIVQEVRKTFDEVYVITSYKESIVDCEDEALINKMYTKKLTQYADMLLNKYPNVANVIKLMGIDKSDSKKVIEAVKSLNGIQNDFFAK